MKENILPAILEESLKFTFGAMAGFALGYYRHFRSKKALQTGRRTDCIITIDETKHKISNDKIPGKDDAFFVDQDISICDSEAPLSAFLPNDVQTRITQYLQQARKLCTVASPLIYEHLRTVTPQDEYNNVINTLNRGIIRYLGGKYNRPGNNEVRTAFLPVLIGEPYAPDNEFRIILLSEEQTQFIRLPRPEALRYPVFDKFRKYFVSDPTHPHADRIDLHRSIAIRLADPRNRALFAARVDIDRAVALTATP